MSKLLNTTWDALWKWRYSFLPRPACVTVHCDRQKGVGEDDGADDDGGVEEEWRRRGRCGKLCEETISRWQSVANILQMPPASILQSPVWPDNTHSHSVPSPAVAILTTRYWWSCMVLHLLSLPRWRKEVLDGDMTAQESVLVCGGLVIYNERPSRW